MQIEIIGAVSLGVRGLCCLVETDFMGKPRLLLEAERRALYDEIAVPPDWHQAYGEGKTTTRGFHNFMPGHMVKHGGGGELGS